MDDLTNITGTPVFTGDKARIGYAINKMCYSFNDKVNRDAFLADEEGYMTKYGLNDAQKQSIRNKNVNEMMAAGGNIYYLAKFAGIFGLGVQDVGAQQTGMTLDAFNKMLLDHAKQEA